MIHAAINFGLRHAPPGFGYWLHKQRRRPRLEAWRAMPYFVIHIPKTGGQSIAEALGVLSAGHLVYSDLPAWARAKPLVAVVREPFARLRSTFRYALSLSERFPTTTLADMAGHRSFGAFVRSLSNVEKHYFLRPATGFIAPPVHLIAFENMQEGLDAWHDRLGIERIALPHVNRTEGAKLDLSLREDEEVKVRRLYAADFALWADLTNT